MSKSKFFIGQPIFGQLLKLIPKGLVQRAARSKGADRYYKKFHTYDHLVMMLYSVFHHCNSLREVTTGMLAWEHRLPHLGITSFPRRSTISDANLRRPASVFADIYYQLYKTYESVLPDSRGKSKHSEDVYIFDSTTITLFGEVLKGAGSRSLDGKRKGGIKVHTLLNSATDMPVMIDFSASSKSDSTFLRNVRLPAGSILVFDRGYNHYATFNRFTDDGVTWVTMRRADSIVHYQQRRLVTAAQAAQGVVDDYEIVLGHDQKKEAVKVPARLVEYHDPQTNEVYEFLTNNKDLDPITIADFYKDRWQIEVLFKRFKQNYPLHFFLGDNPNAIQIQIWCALIADLLMKVVKHTTNKRWAFSNMISIIRLHLMTYINLYSFLENPEKALLHQLKYAPKPAGPPNKRDLFSVVGGSATH